MSAQAALKWYGLMLTDYEKKEIQDYPMVYFIGNSRDKKINGSEQNEHNFGYDDEKGDYNVVYEDHVGFRYEVKEFLGKGSFGTALKCLDHKTGKEICMKIIKNKKKYYY
jgi:dual specificity tyrosine-phosphorylation-regulated kinase 2/3/4